MKAIICILLLTCTLAQNLLAENCVTLDMANSSSRQLNLNTLPDSATEPGTGLLGTDKQYPNTGSLCLIMNNASDKAAELSVLLGNPRLNHIEVIKDVSGNDYPFFVAGLDYPLPKWQTLGAQVMFSLGAPAHSLQQYHIKIGHNAAYNSHIQIEPAETLLSSLATQQTTTGMCAGIIFGLVLYFTCLAFIDHDRTYLYLASSSASVAMMQLSDLGILLPLWPYATYWNQITSGFFSSLSTLLGCCMARRYLLTRTEMPRVDKALDLYAWYCLVVCIPLSFTLRYDWLILFYGMPAAVFMLVLLWISITRIRQGYKPAKLYLAAYMFPFINGFGILLTYTGTLPSSPASRLIPLCGTASQLLFFALGLGERINWIRQQNLISKQQAYKNKTETLAKKNFLAHISHELRTPLIGIIGLVRSLDKNRHRDEDLLLIGGIEKSAQHLLDITNTLLDHAKLDAGKWHLNNEWIDIRRLITESVSEMTVLAKQKNLNISSRTDDNLPKELWSDPRVITRLLHEILLNAIKFTHSGSITVTAKMADQTLRMEILDTGIGFDKLFQNKAFELFEMADHSSTREQQGSGMGLALCKKFSERLGGQIGCNSNYGQGTLFWIELPLNTAAPHTSLESNRADDRAAADLHTPDINPVILAAEDDEALHYLLQNQLQRLCTNSRVFTNGRALLDAYLALDTKPPVILLDWNMPIMNGLTTLTAIRQHESTHALPPARIAILTAYDSMPDNALPPDKNIEILKKPVTPESLQRLLSPYTRAHETREQAPPA